MNRKHLILPALVVAGLVSVGCTSYQIVPTDSLTNTDNTTNTEINTQINTDTNTQESVQTQNNIIDNNQNTSIGKITQEQAREIALKHANSNIEDVVFINSHIDYDDGRKAYDVTFYKNNTEYDYEIDALTGNIISVDNDIEDYIIPETNNSIPEANNSNSQSQHDTNNTTNSSVNSNKGITGDKAKEIALSHANLSKKDVSMIRAYQQFDDGIRTYEVEFYHNFMEYNYEIDYYTGNILSYELD